MIFRITISLFCLLLMPAAQAAEENLRDEVLARLVEAYGGAGNLAKLNRMSLEWDMVALQGNRHGTDRRYLRMPGQLRVELSYPDRTETRMLDGDAAYVVFNGGEATPAQPPQRDAMRLQLMRHYSPLALSERRDRLSVVQDGPWLALSLTENGLQADYLVNTDTWRIEKVAGTLRVNGMEMRFLTEYSDFRFVDGVLIHHAENKFAGSVNTARLILEKVQLDTEPGDGLFQP